MTYIESVFAYLCHNKAWMALLVFLMSCGLTVALIMHRPYLYIRTSRRHLRLETYFLGALLGPVLLFALGLLSWPDVTSSLQGTARLQPLGIMAIFLSMVFISIFLDITGVFEYAARVAVQKAKGDGRRLFFSLYATVAFLTIFTSNDIIILTFTPLVYYFTRHAKLNPVPYLMAEFFAANTWSMLLYIGNPTNIVMAGAFELSFTKYTLFMAMPTLAAGCVNLAGLYWLSRKAISKPLALHNTGAPRDAITDGPGAVLGIALLTLCIAALSLAPSFGMPLWPVALCTALGLLAILIVRRSWARLLRRDLTIHGGTGVRRTLGRMPWPMIPFILSLFIMVGVLQRYGLTSFLGRTLASMEWLTPVSMVWIAGFGSAVAANILNNIPMTLAAAGVISEIPAANIPAAAFAVAVGANLGANLTPLGALAGLMWMSILKDKKVNLNFFDFIRYGLIITPWTLAAALSVLALLISMFNSALVV